MIMSREKTYAAWRKIVRACTDRRHPWYPRYGAVGATICSQWTDNYHRFMQEVGQPQPGQTRVARLDETRPFEPGNCVWAYPAMGCRPGVPQPREKAPARSQPREKAPARDWAGMTRMVVYLEQTLLAKIMSEAARLGKLENRRITLATLVRETIEKIFGGAE